MHLYNKEESIRDDMMDKIRDLLIDHNKKTGSNIPTDYSIDLSTSQKRAFIKFKMGDSLLILGSAGVGKSKLVKEFVKYNRNNDNDILRLLDKMTIDEKFCIMSLNFNIMWYKSALSLPFNNKYTTKEISKFEKCKNRK